MPTQVTFVAVFPYVVFDFIQGYLFAEVTLGIEFICVTDDFLFEALRAEMKGWALVLVSGDRCSAQTIVTRCTLYQQYTTEEALQAAAKSYKGLTETPFLSPR